MAGLGPTGKGAAAIGASAAPCRRLFKSAPRRGGGRTLTMLLISVLFLGLLSAGQVDYATFLSEVNKKRAQHGAPPVCISKYRCGWCLRV